MYAAKVRKFVNSAAVDAELRERLESFLRPLYQDLDVVSRVLFIFRFPSIPLLFLPTGYRFFFLLLLFLLLCLFLLIFCTLP